MKISANVARFVFYGLMLLAALVQAGFTDLSGDEAYYWLYSTHLSWGYFDHPPVIALLIKCGYWLLPNALGVRLMTLLMSIGSIYLLEKLIAPRNLLLFYALIISVALLHIGGILALPDIPLLFFSLTFFLLYKKYLEQADIWVAALLGINAGLLLLSKYHGLLVLVFTLFSNLQLLKKASFYLIVLIGCLLFAPHLWWQYEHHFPTFNYQLFERSPDSYSWTYTSEYLLGQLFLFGPVISILLLYLSFKRSPVNLFQRALKFNLYGIYLFFLLMTLKGRVEANWTITEFAPLFYLSYSAIEESAGLRKFIYYTLPISLAVAVCLRISVIHNILPEAWGIKTEFNDNANWAKAIESVAGNRPVAFMNSYKKASMYCFYTGHTAIALNNVMARKNQFTTWDSEAGLQGDTVMLVANYPVHRMATVQTPKGNYQYEFIPNFRSFSNILISSDTKEAILKATDTMKLSIGFNYTNSNRRDFSAGNTSLISYEFTRDSKFVSEGITGLKMTNEMADNGKKYEIKIIPPPEKGIYDLHISIRCGSLPPTINSRIIKVIVG